MKESEHLNICCDVFPREGIISTPIIESCEYTFERNIKIRVKIGLSSLTQSIPIHNNQPGPHTLQNRLILFK